MSVATVSTRLAEIQATVSGVKRAYAQGPASLPPSDLPIFVNFTGPATEDWATEGENWGVESRVYVMRLYVRPLGQGIDGEAERLCEPFFANVRDTFAGRPGLGKGTIDTHLPFVDALFLGDQGVSVLNYASEQFVGIEFHLQVKETFKRRYSAE